MSRSSRASAAKRLTAIQQTYTRLWTAFVDAANAQSLGADALDSRGAVVAERDGVATAFAEFLLKGWPFKAVSKKRAVDIAVRVTEMFSTDLNKVERATTCAVYLLRETSKGTNRPLLELHYDFELPVREAHPTFHAQLGATSWSEDQLQMLGMVGPIQRDNAEHDYANARIPTAFMGFGPILVMLAADHLRPRNFRQMMKAARAVDSGKVDPDCSSLVESMLPVGIPHAYHWYDERYVVHEWNDKKAKVHRAAIPVLGETYCHNDPFALRQEVAAKLSVAVKDLKFVSGAPPSQKA